jgi:hypothetical protein
VTRRILPYPSPALFAREKVPAAKRWADEGVLLRA